MELEDLIKNISSGKKNIFSQLEIPEFPWLAGTIKPE